MTRKRIIEIRCHNSIEQIEAEIFRYGGFVFGLHWSKSKYEITATELSTGLVAGRCSYWESRSPRKDLINRIKKLVDSGEMKKSVRKGISDIERKLAGSHEEERKRYKHPLNKGLLTNS